MLRWLLAVCVAAGCSSSSPPASSQAPDAGSGETGEDPRPVTGPATTRGLLRSSDDGVHREEVRTARAVTAVAVDPAAPQTLVIGEGDMLLRSTDRGATWTQVLCRCDFGTYASFHQLVFDGGSLLAPANAEYKGSGGLFRSDDGGQTFIEPEKRWLGSLAFLHTSVFALDSTGLTRSVDAGAAWTTVYSTKRALVSLAIDPAGTFWAGAFSGCGDDPTACSVSPGGVLVSRDGGGTWTDTPPDLARLTV